MQLIAQKYLKWNLKCGTCQKVVAQTATEIFSTRHPVQFSLNGTFLFIDYELFVGKQNRKRDIGSNWQKLEDTDTDDPVMRFPGIPLTHTLEWIIKISTA